MRKNYVIDRRTLPYDAFVPDESWLIPMDEEVNSWSKNSVLDVLDVKKKHVKDSERQMCPRRGVIAPTGMHNDREEP